MPAGTYDDLKKRIDEWTVDVLTDADKMQAWMDRYDYIIPGVNITEKETLIDELLGEK